MKKRLLTILLIFCMVLTMIPVGGVFADSTDITKGDITYSCNDDGTATVTRCYIEASGEIEIPSSVSVADNSVSYTVTGIDDDAFSSCTKLEKITFADDSQITSIGASAFYNCSSLTSITIPKSVTSIGTGAFSGCTELTGIIFAADSQLKSIEYGAFYECKKLGSIEIPDSVTSIGERAFSGCTGLTSITIPNSVTSIGDEAFSECKKLGSITIPNNVTSIGERAFSGCTGLTSITIPNNVTSIGVRAFIDCKGLTSITISNNVTSIGDSAFLNCTGLTVINVDGNNPNYSSADGVLFNKDKTTLITCPAGKTDVYKIPTGVTNIGIGAFSGCKGLTSVIIPNSVKSIGTSAFSGCSALKSIEIPNSVTSIGDSTFIECTGLTSIAIPTSVESIDANAFEGCSKLTTVIYGDKTKWDTTLTDKFPAGTTFIFLAAKPEFGVNNITSNSVTLNEITGATDASKKSLTAKYRVKTGNINTDDGWQDSSVFEGLNPDTEYIFQVGFFDNSSDEQPTAVYELAPVRTTPSYTPPANPTIDITGKEGGTVIYDRMSHTVTITPNDNYLVKEISLNGTTIPVTDGAMVLENIYGWSRISVTFEPKPEPAFEPDKYISKLKFKASSSKTSKGNIRIKVTSVTDDNGNKIDLTELKDKGYTVKFKYYRSTKKASKYTAKVEKNADINSYINTSGKKGTKYYYKVRVMVYDAGGNLVAKSDLKQCSYAARTWSK